MCILFYVQNSFPTIGYIVWDKSRPVTEKINGYIEKLGENFETILDGFLMNSKEK